MRGNDETAKQRSRCTSQPEPCKGLPARRESPERAQPSLAGVGGTPQPLSAPLPAREVGGRLEQGGAHSRAPLRNEDWSRPEGEVPVRRESPEGAQPCLVGGFGIPRPLSAPLPAREVGGRLEQVGAHSRAPLRNENWSRPQGEVPVRRESPERAQPSLVGLGGTPQPLSAPLPAREVGGRPERVPRPQRCRSSVTSRKRNSPRVVSTSARIGPFGSR